MAQVIIDDTHLKSIADKIRESTGSDDTYTPSQMADGVGEVFDAGKMSEQDYFWEVFQEKGRRTGWSYVFRGNGNTGNASGGWDMSIYNPKYPFKVSYTCSQMFYNCKWLTDTKVPIDLTDIDANPNSCMADQLFQSCSNLVTVNKIIARKDHGISWSYSFAGCKNLKNITFEPNAIKKSSLITMPFNEAFYKEEDYLGMYFLNDSIYDVYATYCAPGNVSCEGPASYPVTYVCFEDGTKITFWKWCQQPLPDWFIPEDETQEVSFYLENPSRECLCSTISFADCPLTKESITNIFISLSVDSTDNALTLNKAAVNAAFNIDVDTDESTWNWEYQMLVQARPNWTISYA